MLAFYQEMFDVVPLAHEVVHRVGRPAYRRQRPVDRSMRDRDGLPLAMLNRRHFEPLTIFGLTLL